MRNLFEYFESTRLGDSIGEQPLYYHYLDIIQTILHCYQQLSYKWFLVVPPNLLSPSLFSIYSHGETNSVGDIHKFSLNDWKGHFDGIFCEALSQIHTIKPAIAAEIIRNKDRIVNAAFLHLRACKDNGASFILQHHASYPQLLKNISDAPLALTVRGDLSLFHRHKVAVIGARKADRSTLSVCYQLAKRLAAHSVIVSGGAYGCDIAAHAGARDSLYQPCPTIVVTAGGLMDLYPAGNHGIFRDLARSGALFVSERLWTMPSRPMDFPVRNRLISGMSSAVIVMQAHTKSGALITARMALDQGRDVHVYLPDKTAFVSGSFDALASRFGGSLALAEQGAPVFDNIEQITGEWA